MHNRYTNDLGLPEGITVLKDKDIKPLREELHNKQNKICPICKDKLSADAMALDHQHKLFADQPLLENGAGLCRGVICMQCNAWEGKMSKGFKRMGLHKKKNADMIDMIRNLADYLEQENLPYIHPREVPKEPQFMKNVYNKIIKQFKLTYPKKKVPAYPSSKKWTKLFIALSEEFEIYP